MNPLQKIGTNDFKYVRVIGRGAFAKVYLVKKKDTDEIYAMKILKKEQLIKKNLFVKTQGKFFSQSKIFNLFS